MHTYITYIYNIYIYMISLYMHVYMYEYIFVYIYIFLLLRGWVGGAGRRLFVTEKITSRKYLKNGGLIISGKVDSNI